MHESYHLWRASCHDVEQQQHLIVLLSELIQLWRLSGKYFNWILLDFLNSYSYDWNVLFPPLKQFVVILLVGFSALSNKPVNAKPTPDDGSYTGSASLDVEPSPFIDEENDYFSSLPELTRSRRNRGHGHHHAGFVAGAATGAVIANHNEPNYYAPTYYYPTTYYPSNSYYDGYYITTN